MKLIIVSIRMIPYFIALAGPSGPAPSFLTLHGIGYDALYWLIEYV